LIVPEPSSGSRSITSWHYQTICCVAAQATAAAGTHRNHIASIKHATVPAAVPSTPKLTLANFSFLTPQFFSIKVLIANFQIFIYFQLLRTLHTLPALTTGVLHSAEMPLYLLLLSKTRTDSPQHLNPHHGQTHTQQPRPPPRLPKQHPIAALALDAWPCSCYAAPGRHCTLPARLLST
jgi:hypothetical protein